LYIKSSGTWFKDSLKKNSFTKIDLNSIKKNIKNEKKWKFARSKSYPSIETLMHALIHQKYVVHLHSISVLSYAVLKEGKEILETKLKNFKWVWIKYKKPGLNLALEIKKNFSKDINIYILQNHGIIYAANTLKKINLLLKKIEKKLKRNITFTLKKNIQKKNLSNRLFLKPKDKIIQNFAWNKKFFKIIQNKSLYPDHVVFLYNKILALNNYSENILDKKIDKKVIVLKNYGVFVGENISFAEYEMLLCLAMLLRILPLNDNLSFLNKIQEKELINWDKEILRQNINKG